MQCCLLQPAKLSPMPCTIFWGSILLAFSVPLLQPLLTSSTYGSSRYLHHSNTFHFFAYVGHSIGSHSPLLHMPPCFLISHQIPLPLPFHLPAPTCFMVSHSPLSPAPSPVCSNSVKTKTILKPCLDIS